MALTKAGGTWVVGDRFFDRSADLVALGERCQEGAHTLLTAQRRIARPAWSGSYFASWRSPASSTPCLRIWRVAPRPPTPSPRSGSTGDERILAPHPPPAATARFAGRGT